MPESFRKISCTACRRVTYWRRAPQRQKGIEHAKIEANKYCKFCRKHTTHKESK